MDKKRGEASTTVIVALVLGIVFLVTVLFIFYYTWEDIEGGETSKVKEVACYIGNALRYKISGFGQTTCRAQIVRIPIEEKEISLLLRKCWMMYGSGEWDVPEPGVGGTLKRKTLPKDPIHTCYAFTPNRTIERAEIGAYLLSHKKGKVTDTYDSDYSYLKRNTPISPLCINEEKLEKGKTYFILFGDVNYWIESKTYEDMIDFWKGLLGSDSPTDRVIISSEKKDKSCDRI